MIYSINPIFQTNTMTFTVLRESCPKNGQFTKMPSLIPNPHAPPMVRARGRSAEDPVRSQSGSCAAWTVSEGCVSEAPHGPPDPEIWVVDSIIHPKGHRPEPLSTIVEGLVRTQSHPLSPHT